MTSRGSQDIALPTGIYLEPTNRCNLRCRTCLQHGGMPESARDLGLGEAKAIADQFPVLRRVVLHGIGEPLLNPAIFDMIAHFKTRGAYVLFNSNALLLDRTRAERLAAAGLDELRVSMDAGMAATYARIRPGGSFPLLVRNIEGLIRIKARRRQLEPKISAWMVATRDNIHDLPELIRLAARMGIAEVYLQRLVYCLDSPGHGVAVRNQAVVDPTAEILTVLDQSLQLGRRRGVRLNASGLTSPQRSLRSTSRSGAPWRGCRRPQESMYITAQGNVLPCCIAPFATSDYASLVLGNAFVQRIERIWQDEPYRRFRRRQQSFRPPPACRGCGVEWSL